MIIIFQLQIYVPLTSKSHVYGPAKEETKEYDVGSTFGLVTDIQTESDAYMPTLHGHRWA